jgi:AraC-like DNA-binding protein
MPKQGARTRARVGRMLDAQTGTAAATELGDAVLQAGVAGIRARRFTIDALYRGIKEHYAIGYVDRGWSEWWRGGRVWSSGPGSVSLKQPGDVHRDLRRSGPSRVQVIVIDTALVEAARMAGGHRGPPSLRRVHLGEDDPQGAPFRRLHRLLAAAADAGTAPGSAATSLVLEEAAAEAVAALAAELSSGSPDGIEARCSRAVRRARSLLHDRFAEALTLEDLSAAAGLDKFHLSRAFRDQVGLPPHAYLTQLRIAEAKKLLAAGVPAAEVASRVGLYDQSQLHRHFRRIVGTTPGRYARQLRDRVQSR